MRSPSNAPLLTALTTLVAPLLAPALALAGLAVPTAAEAGACTAPELVWASVDAPTVVVGPDRVSGVVLTAAVRSHGCAVSHVDVDLFTPTGFSQSFRMARLGAHDGVATYEVGVRISAGAVSDADAGRWRSAVYVSWAGGNTNDDGPEVPVRREARLSADAGPEPATAGDPLTVRGRLSRTSWDTGAWSGLGGQRVRLQFRPSGGRWATVAETTSSRSGAVTRTVTARRDGCYRLVFPGTATTARTVSRADCVDVR